MNNEQMKANRFANWAKARNTVKWIKSHLEKGDTVCITNHARSTQYKGKAHLDSFLAKKDGVYVKQGKNFVCLNGNKISAFV